MDNKNDLPKLQQLSDAIALTLDAIRRIAPAASNGAIRGEVGWTPSAGVAATPSVGGRFSHSAWAGWGPDGAPPAGIYPPPWPHAVWPAAIRWGRGPMF